MHDNTNVRTFARLFFFYCPHWIKIRRIEKALASIKTRFKYSGKMLEPLSFLCVLDFLSLPFIETGATKDRN